MTGFSEKYLERPHWFINVIGAVVVVAGANWLSHALAYIPRPEPIQWRRIAVEADGRFSEASLQRFAATMDPGASALARRYAPSPRVVLSNAASAPSELSYDSDPGPLPAGFQDLTPDRAAAANAHVPFSKAPNPAAKPFRLPAIDAVSKTRALDCLTMAVYYEAASESADGQAAVAQVVLNRLHHPLFPKTVCGVVFEGSKLSTGCQFSFTCDGSLARRPSQAGWRQARQIAARALGGYVLKSIGEATHYHTMWVVPYWQPSVVKLTQIGAHIFYRWQGGMGLPGAFRQQYAGPEAAPPAIPGFVGDAPAPIMTAVTAASPANAATLTLASPPEPAPETPAPPPAQLAELTPPVATPSASETSPTPAPTKPTGYFGSSSRVRNRLALVRGW